MPPKKGAVRVTKKQAVPAEEWQGSKLPTQWSRLSFVPYP